MSIFAEVYQKLLAHFGGQRWWPTTTAARETEIIIGAILTQNTSWKNVEKAISNLAAAGMIDFRKLAAVATEKIAQLVRPSGYYNQKAERLKLFAGYVCGSYMGDVKRLLHDPFAKRFNPKTMRMEELRGELLELKGIGPETADSIVLYAAGRPVFVVDAYTKRIFSRIGICRSDVGYDELQQLLVNGLPEKMRTAAVYSQYHALLVELGKSVCVKRNPLCSACPLVGFCSCGKAAVKAAKRKSG